LSSWGALPYDSRMRLTLMVLDRLTFFVAAELARRRRARGVRLNHREAMVVIADAMSAGPRATAPPARPIRPAVPGPDGPPGS